MEAMAPGCTRGMRDAGRGPSLLCHSFGRTRAALVLLLTPPALNAGRGPEVACQLFGRRPPASVLPLTPECWRGPQLDCWRRPAIKPLSPSALKQDWSQFESAVKLASVDLPSPAPNYILEEAMRLMPAITGQGVNAFSNTASRAGAEERMPIIWPVLRCLRPAPVTTRC